PSHICPRSLHDALRILRWAAGNAFAVAVGVFESLAAPVGAYPHLLDFGLNVRMPSKYAGLELGWRNHAAAPGERIATGVAVDLIDRKSTRLNSSHVKIS